MKMLSRAFVTACCAGLLVQGASVTLKAAELSDLPDISLLTPYALFGGNLNLHNGDIYGDVAIYDGVAGSDIRLGGPSSVQGDLYLATGATESGGLVTGSVINDTDLAAAEAQVTSASLILSALTPTEEYASVTSATVLGTANGIADVQVINVSSINLGSGESITFSGDAGDYYVINVIDGVLGGGDASLSMSGDATIGDAATAPYLMINLYDNDNWGQILAVDNYIYGTVFIPDGDVITHGLFGAMYATNNEIKVQSDGQLTNVDPIDGTTYAFLSPAGNGEAVSVSEPSPALLLLLGLMLITVARTGPQCFSVYKKLNCAIKTADRKPSSEQPACSPVLMNV